MYQIDNIPFYVPLIACDDIVFAEFDSAEGMLVYNSTVKYSENSTIRVVLFDRDKDINEIREIFDDIGCESERVNDGYFSMNVPAENDYNITLQKLVELSEMGIIDYEESCLSEFHRSNIK